MNFPEPLKQGDKVFLVCTSSPILEEDIEKCKEVVKKLGFEPVLGESLFENIGGYMAGMPEIRVKDLHRAFSDNEVKGIFCVKGGFSASQLLDKLDYELIRNNPKVFVGYSDVTNLNIVFNQKCNLGTFHGPMVKSNMFDDFNDFTKKSFLDVLDKKKGERWKFKNPMDEESGVEKEISLLYKKNFENKKISGEIIGGNLSIIVTTLGTDYEIDTKGKILFIEEIEEEISRIDRMMVPLGAKCSVEIMEDGTEIYFEK
ncbi:peptidase U61 LD-carboxypeptidase A [Leptotrichia shahii]|uniref:Peptidase U61 LD-carboxypeptidase A n=1 Tax=Leptotrichia shahii TaxID=157691 RepID=A0A510JRW2_9FUSO|nr:LD-carboxypeptidase [Leptotrichia shahii]BBM41175.1 peptidase U61 LD-carboxypeptidase A [Leptotrichia shahii]